jgi:anti-sigma regulatory factor (Ser/Thr protein kinase)
MPLRKISCAESHGWLDQRAFPWLAAKLQVSTASIAEFKTCVREIFTNIQDHSTEDIGCIHIQFYPNEHRIRISVSDFGIGIPDEIRKGTSNNDDFSSDRSPARLDGDSGS